MKSTLNIKTPKTWERVTFDIYEVSNSVERDFPGSLQRFLSGENVEGGRQIGQENLLC